MKLQPKKTALQFCGTFDCNEKVPTNQASIPGRKPVGKQKYRNQRTECTHYTCTHSALTYPRGLTNRPDEISINYHHPLTTTITYSCTTHCRHLQRLCKTFTVFKTYVRTSIGLRRRMCISRRMVFFSRIHSVKDPLLPPCKNQLIFNGQKQNHQFDFNKLKYAKR